MKASPLLERVRAAQRSPVPEMLWSLACGIIIGVALGLCF